MNTSSYRSSLGLTLLLLLAGPACGEDPTPADDVPEVIADVVEDVADEPVVSSNCCAAGVCNLGEFCLDGACHPIPGPGRCYRDGECTPGQLCEGANVCDCEDMSCVIAAGDMIVNLHPAT